MIRRILSHHVVYFELHRIRKNGRKRVQSLIVSIAQASVPAPNSTTLSCYKVNSFSVGDLVWAKAPKLPSWPGKIISYKEKKEEKLRKPPRKKVKWALSYLHREKRLISSTVFHFLCTVEGCN